MSCNDTAFRIHTYCLSVALRYVQLLIIAKIILFSVSLGYHLYLMSENSSDSDVSLTWSSVLGWPPGVVVPCWPCWCCWASVLPAARVDFPVQDSKLTARDVCPHPVPGIACAGALSVSPLDPLQWMEEEQIDNKILEKWYCSWGTTSWGG